MGPPRRRFGRRWAMGTALILLFHAGVAAQELRGRVRGTYQSVGSEQEDTETLLQDYLISFKNNVAPGLFWQLRIRALLSSLDREDPLSSEQLSTDTTLLEPFLQIVYEGPAWQFSGGGRLTRRSPRNGTEMIKDRERRDLFARVGWARAKRPSFEWSLSRIEQEEEDIETTTDDRSLLTINYSGSKGMTSLGLENRHFIDHRTDFERDLIRGTWNGNLRESLFGGRVVLSGQALVLEGRTEEETPEALEVDVQRRPARGLFAIDTTPLSGILADTSALIDGNLSASAADLSGDFRNLGVDLGFAQSVDTVSVFVERRLLPGNTGDYAWDVYTSTDGDFWTLEISNARSRFEDLENRFEIEFTPVSARYLKVVNTSFSRNEPPLAVTEIQLFGQETRTGVEERTESRRSVNASASWRAHERVDVNLNSFASRQANENPFGDSVREDWGTTLTTTLRPDHWVATLRLQSVNRSQTLADPERDRTLSLGFSTSPLPRLDLSIIGTHRRNTSRGDLLLRFNSVNLRLGARFLHDVETALDLSVVRQEDGRTGRTTTRRRANLSLVTTLRPGIILSNNWSAESVEFGGLGAVDDRTDVDLRTRLSYRPTRVFGATVEYLYQDIAGESGTSELLDLDWLPFPGGALQLQFNVTRDRRSIFGDRRDETRASLRWSMNPKTILDATFAIIRVGEKDTDRQELFTAFLEYRF